MDSFFGIGPVELIFILIFALIFLGPERLPVVVRDVASFIRKMQLMYGEITQQLNDEFSDLRDLDPRYQLNQMLKEDEEEAKEKAKKGETSQKADAKTSPASGSAKKTETKKVETKKGETETQKVETKDVEARKTAGTGATAKSTKTADRDGMATGAEKPAEQPDDLPLAGDEASGESAEASPPSAGQDEPPPAAAGAEERTTDPVAPPTEPEGAPTTVARTGSRSGEQTSYRDRDEELDADEAVTGESPEMPKQRSEDDLISPASNFYAERKAAENSPDPPPPSEKRGAGTGNGVEAGTAPPAENSIAPPELARRSGDPSPAPETASETALAPEPVEPEDEDPTVAAGAQETVGEDKGT